MQSNNNFRYVIDIRYIIDKKDSSKFEDLARKIVGRKRKCQLYIRHKTLMIPPSVLKKNGIKFTRVCLFLYYKILKIVIHRVVCGSLLKFGPK